MYTGLSIINLLTEISSPHFFSLNTELPDLTIYIFETDHFTLWIDVIITITNMKHGLLLI